MAKIRIPESQEVPTIKSIFKDNKKARRGFIQVYADLKSGRHVLDIPLIVLNRLNGSIMVRDEVFMLMFGPDKYDDLGLYDCNDYDKKVLSAILYNALIKGLTAKLNAMELKSHISLLKIETAARAVKNNNGMLSYGGSTIRDFITHAVMSDVKSELKEENKGNSNNDIIDKITDSIIFTQTELNKVKSVPFSVFQYTSYICTNQNGIITQPDVEAKHNLRKIVGRETYQHLKISDLTIFAATEIERRVVEHIRLLVKKELDDRVATIKLNVENKTMRDTLVESADLNKLINISKSGLIYDIIHILDTNINTVLRLQKTPNIPINDEDANALFRAAYVACDDTLAGSDWLPCCIETLNGEYATYNTTILALKYNYFPFVFGRIFTEYNISINVLERMFSEASKKENALLAEEFSSGRDMINDIADVSVELASKIEQYLSERDLCE